MSIEQYIQEQTGLSTRQIAEKSGLTHTKLSRQFNGNTALTLDTLKDIALGTGLDFLDLAVKANLLTQTYVDRLRAKGALRAASDQELAAEALSRIGSTATINENEPFSTNPYAAPERLGTGEDTQFINELLDAASAQSMETGHNCALVMSDDPVAMIGADTATVGRYMGNGQIIDRAEIF